MSAEQTHERVTAAELAKIERLDREATPGPWTEYVPDFPEYENPGVRHAGDADYGRVARIASRQADAAFIAAARTLLPRLAASERARREDDTAIGRMLDEAGCVPPTPGETLLSRVHRLIERAEDAEAGDATSEEQTSDLWHAIEALTDDVDDATWQQHMSTVAEHGTSTAPLEELRVERVDIMRALGEAGVTAREGETLRARVAALTVDACASRMTCERLIAERNEQRARAEQAEAKLAALRAPVDVDADPLTCAVLDAADGIYPSEVPPGSRYERVAAVLLPHVERAARLAREAEGLRAECATANNIIRAARAALPERGSECYAMHDAPRTAPGEVTVWRVSWTGLRDAVIYEFAEHNGKTHRVEIGPRDEVNITTWLLGPVESHYAWLKDGPFPRWSEVPEGWAFGLALALVSHLSSVLLLREHDLVAASAEIEQLARELTEARVALVSAERRATERAEGRPLSEPWNTDAVYAVRALLHDDSQ